MRLKWIRDLIAFCTFTFARSVSLLSLWLVLFCFKFETHHFLPLEVLRRALHAGQPAQGSPTLRDVLVPRPPSHDVVAAAGTVFIVTATHPRSHRTHPVHPRRRARRGYVAAWKETKHQKLRTLNPLVETHRLALLFRSSYPYNSNLLHLSQFFFKAKN